MQLYGTTTSPFVRRVRAVAAEVGEPVDLVNTAPDAGQAQLREVSPIRKVPVAIVDGKKLYDSRVINDWLVTTRGFGTLAPSRDRWRQENLINATDAALESIVQLFYLKRDNVPTAGSAFETRQRERADAIFAWLATEVAADGTSFESGFGLAELALITTLDWMEFRDMYPVAERATGLLALRAAWRDRASLVATRPHA